MHFSISYQVTNRSIIWKEKSIVFGEKNERDGGREGEERERVSKNSINESSTPPKVNPKNS